MKKWMVVLGFAGLLAACGAVASPDALSGDLTEAEVGFETLSFAGIQWLILDKQADRKLVISEDILDIRTWHETNEPGTTWETSDIRGFLNGEFLAERFSSEERARIVETRLENPGNPRFGTPGGNATNDFVFLLSLEEVVRYFGDSGQLANEDYAWMWAIEDEFSRGRVAYLAPNVDTSQVQLDIAIADGNSWSWWLRSPGGHEKHGGIPEIAYVMMDAGNVYIENSEEYVNEGGVIDVEGAPVYFPNGVRPALWLYR